MPGLRFKKRSARRHTVDNLEQNAKDIEAATMEQAQKKKEKEKFLELFKFKYPNHAKDVNLSVDDIKDNSQHASQHTNGQLSCGEEVDSNVVPAERILSPGAASVKRSNSLSNKPNDHLFLRYHGEMRRVPIPKRLTMAGLKKMFIESFHLDSSVADWPDNVLYIQDRHTDQWSELQDPSLVADTGILLLRDLNQSGLPLLNHNTTTAVDTDSTDASTTQSPITRYDNQSQIRTTRRTHMYESIDNFSKRSRRHYEGSSSGQSRDATPPMTTGASWQPSCISASQFPKSRRLSTSSMKAEQKINELTTHIASGGKHLTHSMSSIASVGSPDHLAKSVKHLHHSVRQVRSDFHTLRALHSRQLQSFEHFMKYSCSQIMSHIRMASLNTVNPDSSLRLKRLEVEPEEEAYQMQAQGTFTDFRLLEAAVDEITVDITQRQCRVLGLEIEKLASAVASSARALIELQHRYIPLEESIKDVMERELEVIVLEERMIKDEGQNLEDAIIKCKDMTETLLSLRKMVASDSDRSFIVPVICPASEPDRLALLENIQAITPNHEARMNSIAIAEEAHRKKKELLRVDGIKVLARDLRYGKLQLRTVVPIHELERRRQAKLKRLFVEEKAEKEQQQITDQELARKALDRRKELERLREEQRKDERLEEQRALEKRKLEEKKLQGAKKLDVWRKDQQQRMVEEQHRRRDDSLAVQAVMRNGAVVKRRSVAMDGPLQTPRSIPMEQRYSSSGVPFRNSVHIPLNAPPDQWRGTAGTVAQGQPKSMDIQSSAPIQTPRHRREGPIGGYPSPPNHQPPQLPQSANPIRHHTRVTAMDKPMQNRRTHTLNHLSAVVHPSPPQTHHNKLMKADDAFTNHDQQYPNRKQNAAAMLNNNYPSKPPPQRRQPYTTTYTHTEHGPTLYSMV